MWSNYSDLTRVLGPRKGCWGREIPFISGNLGWWNSAIWPERWYVDISPWYFFRCIHTFCKKVKPLIPCCFRNINFDPFGSVWKHRFGKHLAWPKHQLIQINRKIQQIGVSTWNPGVFRSKKIHQPLGKKRLFEFRLPMAGHLQHEVYRPPGGGCVFFLCCMSDVETTFRPRSMDYILVHTEL